nr:hypothetical protein GCM10010200_098900 [Actinomadura rugatobispora]
MLGVDAVEPVPEPFLFVGVAADRDVLAGVQVEMAPHASVGLVVDPGVRNSTDR